MAAAPIFGGNFCGSALNFVGVHPNVINISLKNLGKFRKIWECFRDVFTKY